MHATLHGMGSQTGQQAPGLSTNWYPGPHAMSGQSTFKQDPPAPPRPAIWPPPLPVELLPGPPLPAPPPVPDGPVVVLELPGPELGPLPPCPVLVSPPSP